MRALFVLSGAVAVALSKVLKLLLHPHHSDFREVTLTQILYIIDP